MKNHSASTLAISGMELKRKLQGELNHYQQQLRTLKVDSQSEHDRWYRGTLEKLITRRSRMINILFPEHDDVLYA